MKNSKKPRYYSSLLFWSAIILTIYGSLMIISAEMGNGAGSSALVSKAIMKQGIIAVFSLGLFFFFMRFRFLGYGELLMDALFYLILAALLITRAFGASGGAYGWIRIGSFSIQPAEFAKVFAIYYAAWLFGKDQKGASIKNFQTYLKRMALYFLIILIYQHDLGSACVLLGICYILLLLPVDPQLKKIQDNMIKLFFIVIAIALFGLSPIGTSILKPFSNNYMVGRFLAAADPFAYEYDVGYHLIMGLVSFASGGWFGLGYGNSIHKYMNFPNPSSDFILPVIIEEMGIVFGLLPIIILYSLILGTLAYHASKAPYLRTKIVLIGVFSYIVIHIFLNAGGVSGLIPLTGGPLLLLSSGGSSSMAVLMALGMCECEIDHYRRQIDANNSR